MSWRDLSSNGNRRPAAITFLTMSILERVQSPVDVRAMTRDELKQLADDLRERLIDVCSRTGGHIGAGLGVVELTIALHYAFDTPLDQLVWDVGHQGYPHKLLTGRNARMETLRQGAVSPDSSSAARVSTTRSVLGTPRPPSRRRSGSPLAETFEATNTRSSRFSATGRSPRDWRTKA